MWSHRVLVRKRQPNFFSSSKRTLGDAENVSALSARRPPVPGLCESLTTASPMAFFDGEVPLEWERAEKLAASQQEHMIESAASTRVPREGRRLLHAFANALHCCVPPACVRLGAKLLTRSKQSTARGLEIWSLHELSVTQT